MRQKTPIHTYICIQKTQMMLASGTTQAGHVRDLNYSAAKPGGFAAISLPPVARETSL